ncbi:MAG TPA: hypothetical protein VNI01_15010, partial [Elusimicrobiota bacterium]|nr:hypothetical protein [Elusimicrobiota bacterium]
ELAGAGKWRVRPAAEGRVVVYEEGPWAVKGTGPAQPAKRLEWLYDGKALSGIAPNRLDPSLPVWTPDHTAVFIAVRDMPLSDGRTLRQAAQEKVAEARKAIVLSKKSCPSVGNRPEWVVDPAPADAIGYLIRYQWEAFRCLGAPATFRWIYDGKTLWSYGAGPALDPKLPRWRPLKAKP